MKNAAPYKSTATAPIQFREEPAVGGKQLASTFSITFALLLLVWAIAHYARRKGWLDRWLPAGTSSRGADQGMWILRSRRISRQTVLHTVIDGDARYVLVESKSNVSIACLHDASASCRKADGNEAD